jgi:hypothetical protein
MPDNVAAAARVAPPPELWAAGRAWTKATLIPSRRSAAYFMEHTRGFGVRPTEIDGGRTMVDTVIVENEAAPVAAISWPAVLAGAAVAGAFSLMLLALGSGIGFATFSPWSPRSVDTLRGATFAGIFLAATAVISAAMGGYITGRLRHLWPSVHTDEVVFRDHAHGLITWAVATLATAAFLGSAGTNLLGGAATEATRGATEMQARAGAHPDFTDRLFQYDRVKAPPAGASTAFGRPFEADRATADRLIATAATRPLTTEEHADLTGIIASRTGMAPADADGRATKIETEARVAADTARRVAMRLAFWTVAAMLLGALAASLAAWEGGALRDRPFRR